MAAAAPLPVAILGASGFVGAELLRLLAGHPRFAAARLFADSQAGARVADVHPHLALAYPAAVFADMSSLLAGERVAPLEGCRLVFAALPHGQSQKIAAIVLESGAKFVDLGADFRLDDVVAYQRWYGEPHGAPELLGRFVYGIPELNRARIAGADAVAAPRRLPPAHPPPRHPRAEAAARPDRTRDDHDRCRLGRQRRRQGTEGSHPFQHGRREYQRLRPARPSPHRRDGDGAGRQHGAGPARS